MEARKVVLHETCIVAAGVLICLAVMYGAFALAGYFDVKVLVGGIVGALIAILNFFFMAVSASNAMDKAAEQDVKAGKAMLKMSRVTRMLIMFVILAVFAKSGIANPLACVLPLVFVRPVLTVAEFFRKK